MIFKTDESAGELNGFLDAGSHMHGELRFEDTFRVDGKLTGKVTSTGSLVVGEGGVVDGEISVARIFVSGTVKGLLVAEERVEIVSRGRVEADIQTPSLIIEDGAFFEGRCAMHKPVERQTPSLVRAAAAARLQK